MKFNCKAVLSVALAMLLTACGNSGFSSVDTLPFRSGKNLPTENAEEGKEVVIGIYRDGAMEELDAASYKGPHFLYKMIYDGLVEDGGEAGIIPALATSWDIGSDGKTYIFHLREGVKFSDGSDFNADNVVFNMKRWINNERHASLTSMNVDSIEAVDENTVKIVYKDVAYPILTELSYPRPVRFLSENSVDIAEGESVSTFKAMPVGTGQWMFETYEKDNEFTLVPNPYYWGEKPKIDRIRFKVITDSQARLMALKSGEIDILGGDLVGKIPMESIVDLRDNSNFDVYTSPTLCSHFMFFNQHNEIFQDKNVRLAINHAINKESMVKNLFNGIGAPADGLYQKATPYATNENNYGYEYDLDIAKKLLAEAGFSDNNGDGILEKDGKDFEVDIIFSTEEFPEWKSMVEFIQSELLNIGIRANLNSLDRNGFEEAHMSTKNYDLCILRTASDSWVPHSSIRELFAPLSTLNGDAQVWYDDELIGYINDTLSCMNENERQIGYNNIFGFISENAITVPLYYPITAFAVNGDKISNFEVGINNYAPVNWTTLDIK